jgi:hypothetical protein
MKFVPHQVSFDQVRKWRALNDWILVGTTVIVVLTTFLQNQSTSLQINDGLNAFNSMLISFYIVCDIVSSYFLFKVESKRRLDFLDNSFDTNLSGRKSEEYFTNSHLEPGLYKLAVNSFENVLFSYNISKRMLPGLLAKNFLVIFIFILAASLGEKKIVILIFQLSLPVVLLQQLVRLWVYNLNTEKVLEEFQCLFEDLKTTTPERKSAQILRNIIHYESNISWGSILLSSRVFNKLNPTLSSEWEALKKEYKIQ